MSTPIDVVIVNYNTQADLRDCLRSARNAGADRVIVADNGSNDGSRELVAQHFPEATLLRLDDNPGYGEAANRALAIATSPYALVLNADTVLAPDSLRALSAYLDETPRAGIVGPRLRNPDGSLQPSCYPFPGTLRWTVDNDDVAPLGRAVGALRERSYRLWAHDRPRHVPWVKGAALAVRRSALDAIGGFDRDFFLYHEETDLCYRIGRAGWEVHFAPVTDVVHTGGTSTAQHQSAMTDELSRSTLRFHRMHYRGPHRWLAHASWLGLTATRRAADALRKRLSRSAPTPSRAGTVELPPPAEVPDATDDLPDAGAPRPACRAAGLRTGSTRHSARL